MQSQSQRKRNCPNPKPVEDLPEEPVPSLANFLEFGDGWVMMGEENRVVPAVE